MTATSSADVSDLPTPALLLDLDVLETNLERMQRRSEALSVRLRPHMKTHKCLEVGRLQRALGASGITVSTLEEAWAFAEDGFDDITWAFPLNPSRIPEIQRLRATTDLAVTIDSEMALDALRAVGDGIGVWLEVDCGYGRTGVDPAEPRSVELARRIAEAPGLSFRGCLTHAGHAYHADSPAQIASIAEEERRVMVDFGARLRAAGVECSTLSVGSTPGMSLVRSLSGIHEARPGNYALFDYAQTRLGACETTDCAVSVLSTVVSSRPDRHRSVSDAGALVMSKDLGPDDPPHFGRLLVGLSGHELDSDARIVSVSQEHATISSPLAPGSRIRVLPNHSCLTVAQFDHFTVVRGETVVDRWRILRQRGPREGVWPTRPVA
jgi:D-serine deaminase-like pyridoxal phosphate-dependent protein